MVTYTVSQKMSNTGSIHDLRSQHWDRVIKFPKGQKYAVVLAAYYVDQSGTDGYTTHRTEQSAIRQSRKWRNYSREIIDALGRRYESPDGERLVRIN